jgi:hypothetical protein
MLDETILTEEPPLYCGYGYVGAQVRMPIPGSHDRCILPGAMNGSTGDVLLDVTAKWNQWTHQAYLSQLRSHGRGWHIVLFEDRASQHRSPRRVGLAARLGIEIRWLPKACPELNAMDHLWRHSKREILGNWPVQ